MHHKHFRAALLTLVPRLELKDDTSTVVGE